jgi:hypothetical protein
MRSAGTAGRALTAAALPAVVAVILVLTLTPTSAPPGPPLERCWVCGARGVADVIANVLLFLPLGVVLFLRTRRAGRSVLCGALLSAAIELIQFRLPGRDPSLGDLLFNTLGTGAGVLFVVSAPLWRAPARRWLAPSVAAGAAVCLMAGGVLLLAPALPDGPLSTSWSPTRGNLYHFSGRIRSAGIGRVAPAPGPVRRPGLLRSRLLAGAATHATGTVGKPAPGLAPLFMLLDSRDDEVLLLGLERSDLVFRFRTRASTLRLDQPDLRLAIPPAALRFGAKFNARAWRTERGFCLAFDRVTDCSLGFSLGDTWSILYYPGALSPVAKLLLTLLWVGALFVPAGFWLRRPADALIILPPAVAALLALPRFLHCAPTPPAQVVAVLLGVLCGMALARLSRGPGRPARAEPRGRPPRTAAIPPS